MTKSACFLLLMVLLQLQLWAQPEEQLWATSLTGYLEQDHLSYFDSLPNTGINNSQDETSIGLEVLLKYKKDLRFKGSLRTILNYQRRARTQFLLNEAYVQWRIPKLMISAGKQIIDWGELTGFSAIDRQNRMSYFDFLDLEREELGVWAVQTHSPIGSTNLEFTLVPYFQPPLFYLGESRWLTLPQTSVLPENPTVPISTQFDILTGTTIGPNLQLSVAWEFITGKIDWQFRYFFGENSVPHSTVKPQGFDPEIGLQFLVDLQHETMHLAGATFSTYLGAFNLWGELNFTKTKRLNLEQEWTEDPYYQLAIGTDRMWVFPNNPESNLLVLFEYMYLFNFHQNEYSNLDLDLIFQHTILNKTSYQINYDWKLIASTALELRHRGYYHQFAIEYSPFPFLDLQIRMDWLYGDENSFFGHYRNNKRIQIKGTYLFSFDN